jgi:BirA family biotin operon repressor/biotin-[acetyl-CoA-carboxylase] ligase
MKHVKVDATTSTNDLAKSLNRNITEDIFCVSAQYQTKGKGQHHNSWQSNKAENLLFTLVFNNLKLDVNHKFFLNILICEGLISVLNNYNLPELQVKWPNDILSGKSKISGVLIENTLVGQYITTSYVGIGLNVNQTEFKDLPKATSIKAMSGKEVDREQLLVDIFENLSKLKTYLNTNKLSLKAFKSFLYGYNVLSTFKQGDITKKGVIKDITPFGELKIEFEDQTYGIFNYAQIKQLY